MTYAIPIMSKRSPVALLMKSVLSTVRYGTQAARGIRSEATAVDLSEENIVQTVYKRRKRQWEKRRSTIEGIEEKGQG